MAEEGGCHEYMTIRINQKIRVSQTRDTACSVNISGCNHKSLRTISFKRLQ